MRVPVAGGNVGTGVESDRGGQGNASLQIYMRGIDPGSSTSSRTPSSACRLPAGEIVLVQNWSDELRARVPVP